MFSANTNGGSRKAILPAVARGVTATASKMKLRQEVEFVRHVITMCDRNTLWSPVNRETLVFVTWARSIAARRLKIKIWHECEKAVWICITVVKLDNVSVGTEALVYFSFCCWSWNDAKENVISHEFVLWCGVSRVVIDQNSKIIAGEIGMGLDQSVRLGLVNLFLQH